MANRGVGKYRTSLKVATCLAAKYWKCVPQHSMLIFLKLLLVTSGPQGKIFWGSATANYFNTMFILPKL